MDINKFSPNEWKQFTYEKQLSNVSKIKDQGLLKNIVLISDYELIREKALAKINDLTLIKEIAIKSKDKHIQSKCREILNNKLPVLKSNSIGGYNTKELEDIILFSNNIELKKNAIEKIQKESILERLFALTNDYYMLSEIAKKIENKDLILSKIVDIENWMLRKELYEVIGDYQSSYIEVAKNAYDDELRYQAIKKIKDHNIVKELSKNIIVNPEKVGFMSKWIKKDGEWYYKRFNTGVFVASFITLFIPCILVRLVQPFINIPVPPFFEYYSKEEIKKEPETLKSFDKGYFFESLLIYLIAIIVSIVIMSILSKL